MTKEQLALAQFLYNVVTRGNALDDELDPKRTRENSLARHLDGAASHASDAFFELTGRRVTDVTIFELNIETPAEWTKSAGCKAYPRTR
jgi:hypothetical protein